MAIDDFFEKPTNKFSIGEKVYYINENDKIDCFFITEISLDEFNQEIVYRTRGKKGYVPESGCYKTETEALNTLLQHYRELEEEIKERIKKAN